MFNYFSKKNIWNFKFYLFIFFIVLVLYLLFLNFTINIPKYFSVKNIWLNDINYDIVNWKVFQNNEKISNNEISNKVLSLWIFYDNFLKDPIFVLNNIDNNYINSISELEKNNLLIKNTFWIQNDFYPINFLKSTIKSTNSYTEFKNKISYENANILLNFIKNTNNKYYINLINKRKELSLYDEKFQEKKVINWAWEFIIDLNLIKSDYDKMIQNSLLIKEKINKRERCLNNIKYCENIKYQIDDIKLNYINNEIDYNIDDFVDYKKILDNIAWTFWVLNWCWEKDDLTYYTVRNIFDKAYKLDEIKLYDSEKFNLRPLVKINPYENELINKWAKFFTDIHLNFYSCNNSEFHIKLANMIYFYNKYKNNKLEKFTNFKLSNITFLKKINEVINFENNFLDSKNPNEINYNILLEKYIELYSYIQENHINLNDIENELIQRINNIKQNTNNLGPVINGVIIHNSNFLNWSIIQINESKKTEQKKEIITSSREFLLMNRLAYSILYFNFSPSFYINPEKIVYSEKIDESNVPDISYGDNVWLNYKVLIEEYWYDDEELKKEFIIKDSYPKSEFYKEKIEKFQKIN